MKKTVRIMILLLLILCLSACGASNTEDDSVIASETQEETSASVSETQEETGESVSANTEETVSADVLEPESISKTEDASAFDVDLTVLSSTMVYSEVYYMMCTPDDYLGKAVRMTGAFAVYEGEERNYYACIIADATACCSQGIEFVLDGDFSYPDDYPEIGSTITVSGIFDTYYEGEYMYVQLIDAVLD